MDLVQYGRIGKIKEDGLPLVINNGIICVFLSRTVENLQTVTYPISFTSDVSYAVFGNIITNEDGYGWSGQLNIKTKTTSNVTFPAVTAAKRQVFAIGY